MTHSTQRQEADSSSIPPPHLPICRHRRTPNSTSINKQERNPSCSNHHHSLQSLLSRTSQTASTTNHRPHPSSPPPLNITSRHHRSPSSLSMHHHRAGHRSTEIAHTDDHCRITRVNRNQNLYEEQNSETKAKHDDTRVRANADWSQNRTLVCTTEAHTITRKSRTARRFQGCAHR